MTDHLWKDIFTESKWGKITENISTEIHGQLQFGQKPTETEFIRFFDNPTPKQNFPSNQMKDWLSTNDSPVPCGLFYYLVVLESSLDLLPSFYDHLAYTWRQSIWNVRISIIVFKRDKTSDGEAKPRRMCFLLLEQCHRGLTILFDSVRMGRNTLNCVNISSLAYSSQNFHHQCSWTCTSTRMLKLHVLRTLVDLIDWL